MKDYYKILEVDKNSSITDIKLSYRNLAKKYHPDSNGGVDNFTEIMQDINEAYGVLSKEDFRRKYNIEWDKIYGKPKEEPKRKSSQKREEPKRKRNLSEYFWDGSNPQKYETSTYESFEKFKKRILSNTEKGEFEKSVDYKNRLAVVESELLNNFLGEQKVEMTYEADSERFFISINETLKFQIDISIELAQDFKNSVKNFDIRFSKDLEILEISTKFRGQKFLGKGFDRNWNIESRRTHKKYTYKESEKQSNYSKENEPLDKQNKIVLFALLLFFLISVLMNQR
ncbi:DnaJ-class molecular chaperone with C-terminal Zn finger domain [Thiovulum sp. ES]|nr:DnaJ-class molecular chaperone with C-terminal Zn finger domain [Thiovulum sp. ES]